MTFALGLEMMPGSPLLAGVIPASCQQARLPLHMWAQCQGLPAGLSLTRALLLAMSATTGPSENVPATTLLDELHHPTLAPLRPGSVFSGLCLSMGGRVEKVGVTGTSLES